MADAGESHSHSETNNTLAAGAAVDITSTEKTTEGSSDGENERTTRERLKKTSLAGIGQQSKNNEEELQTTATDTNILANHNDTDINGAGNGTRGRPPKKRSFEDLTRGEGGVDNSEQGAVDADQPNPKSGHHKRMRSRDIASVDHTVARFGGSADVASPVQEESDVEAYKSPGGPGVLVDASNVSKDPVNRVEGVEDNDLKTANTSEQSTASKIAPSSGFANASSTSPFGTAQGTSTSNTTSDIEAKSTSASAFASSGLSAFASSEKSPFGAAAQSNQSSGGFGLKSSSSGFGSSSTGFGTSAFASKPSSGGFGSSTGFGSSSGFGTTTAFGSARPFGAGSSGFGGPTGTVSSFGTGKPFGASKDKETEDTGSEEEDDDTESGQHDAADEQDERFVVQDVETGEEEERTIFACRAKLYHFEKEWKERGVGTVKINMKEEQIETSDTTTEVIGDEESGQDIGAKSPTRRGRLIMRTDGVHRVILNTPIFKSMMIGETDGSEPIGKTMHLTGLEDGKPRAFQIKIGKEEVIKELYWKVIDLRNEAKA